MDIPVVDQEKIDNVFKTLLRMEVELDENPLEFGPRRLNQKTAQVRRHLTELEALSLRLSNWYQRFKAAARSLETDITLSKKHMFANDPEVMAGRNVADRDAMASVKLRAKIEELSHLQGAQLDLESLLVVVKVKRADLRDIQSRLRDQIRLCQEEIGLGSRWGSKVPEVSVDLVESSEGGGLTLRGLQDLFADGDAEEGDLAITAPEEGEGDEVDQLLAALGEQKLRLEEAEANETVEQELDAIVEAISVPEAPRHSIETDEEGMKLLSEMLDLDLTDLVVPANPVKPVSGPTDIDAFLADFDS